MKSHRKENENDNLIADTTGRSSELEHDSDIQNILIDDSDDFEAVLQS